MKGHIYIYTVISFLILLIIILTNGGNSNDLFHIGTILSAIFAVIGVIQIIRRWKENKNKYNVALLLLDIIIATVNVLWLLIIVSLSK